MTEQTPAYKVKRKYTNTLQNYTEYAYTRITPDAKKALQILSELTGSNEAVIIRMCLDAHLPKLHKKAIAVRRIEQQFIKESTPDYTP